jgi:hypothetical protein
MAPDEGQTASGTPRRRLTPMVWYVMGAIALVGIVGGLLASKKSKTKTDEGARAVVVPGDAARTVVVPPCNPPAAVTEANAAALRDVQGTTAVTLPPAPAARTVVVPRCVTGAAGSPALPSAAFVLRAGEEVRAESGGKGGDPIAKGVRVQLLVPRGSRARTVVVPRCREKSKAKAGRQSVLEGRTGDSALVIAPRC